MAWHADQREWDALLDVFANEKLLDYATFQGRRACGLSARAARRVRAGLLGKLEAPQHPLT
jgi:hypothetical protein